MQFLKLAFLSAYAICKIPFNNLTNVHLKNALRPVLVILAMLVMLITVLLIVPFACFRGLIYIYLKIRYREKLIKLLNFISSVFLTVHSGTCYCLLFVTCDEIDTLENEVRNITQALIKDEHELFGVIKYCLGYYYLLKKKVNVDDIFSVVSFGADKALTEDQLSAYLGKCKLTPESLFQLRLLKNPFKGNRYALLLLFHHSIGDAHSLWGFCKRYVFDKQIVSPREIQCVPRPTVNLDDVYITPEFFKGVVQNDVLLESEENHVAFFEDGISCVAKLKALKTKYNCTFDEIILGILSYTFYQHMKNYLRNCPNVLGMGYVRHTDPEIQRHFRSGDFPTFRFANNSAVLLFHAKSLGSYKNFDDFMEYIRTKSQQSARSVLLQTTRVLTDILTFMPEIMYRKVVIQHDKRPILVCSNIGVLANISVYGKRVASCLGGMSTGHAGIFAAYCTVDDELKLILTSKLSYLRSRDALQTMLDNAVLLIQELYDKIQS